MRARLYRERAEELRLKACGKTEERIRISLMSLAQHYEHMAERLEEQATPE